MVDAPQTPSHGVQPDPIWPDASPPRSAPATNPAQRPPARAADGTAQLLPLANFVLLTEARGPNQIDRFQRTRKVTVVANLQDFSLSQAIDATNKIAAGLAMPPDYRIVFTGRAKTLGETFTNFLTAFGLALIFMYMILAAQFENFVHPVAYSIFDDWSHGRFWKKRALPPKNQPSS